MRGNLAIAYRCREIAQDFGPEHRAFEMHKLDECFEPTEVVYHVPRPLQPGCAAETARTVLVVLALPEPEVTHAVR